MKILVFLILNLFAGNCLASELVNTFDEAKDIAEKTEAVDKYKDHQYKVLMPYFGEKYSKVLQGCFKTTKNPDDSKFEMVIVIGISGEVRKVYRNIETNIGLCMFKELENDTFPKPIIFPFYIHVAMSFTK